MSNITLTGRIGSEPEIKVSAGGTSIVSFSFAHGRRYMSDGEWQEDTTWFRVSAFGKFAEHLVEMPKGTSMILIGYLKENKWTDKEGNERKSVEFIAQDAGPSLRFKSISEVVDGPSGVGTTYSKPADSAVEEPF